MRRREKTRRAWWRWRLRGFAVEPLTLSPDDPTHAACYARPRGHDVREAAAALRAAGVDVRTAAGLARLLDDVAARVAARAGALVALGPLDVPDVPAALDEPAAAEEPGDDVDAPEPGDL